MNEVTPTEDNSSKPDEQESPPNDQPISELDFHTDEHRIPTENAELAQLFPFEEGVIKEPGRSRQRLTREARRQQNRKRLNQKKLMTRSQLIEAQNNDPEIQQWKTKDKPSFQGKIAGVLCWRWIPRNQPAEMCDQVVLPRSLRTKILKLAHDEPMAGHMGRERTLQ